MGELVVALTGLDPSIRVYTVEHDQTVVAMRVRHLGLFGNPAHDEPINEQFLTFEPEIAR